MADVLKIGLIGADTSHAPGLAQDFNDETYEHYIPGARLTSFFPGGSPDMELSMSRVEGFTAKIRDTFGAAVRGSIEEVVAENDAILLTSVDGRAHLEQFRKIAPSGKPVFMDKPFAVTSSDARAIAELARQHKVPLMSCSSLRYAPGLVQFLNSRDSGDAVFGADAHGPGPLQETQPGVFWYGIHSAEILYTILGPGCTKVWTVSNEDQDFVTGEWADGRIGTMRCNRKGSKGFGAVLHSPKATRYVDISGHPRPMMPSLAQKIIEMFRTRVSPVPVEETVEIIRFLEAANESRDSGKPVELKAAPSA